MTDIIPVKPLFSGADVTALGEFVAGDAIPIEHGGTGANTVQDAQAALGIVSATSTETLTNKTISGADNTLLAIGNASLINSSININGADVSLGGSRTLTPGDIGAEPADATILKDADIGSSVQAYDADLSAIAELSGTSGLLKKTAADTWTLDTSAYSTTVGTVTSVSGTGTVNGLTLTGTVTSSGSLTLGGALDLSSPPAIGGTTPAAGAFTTLSSTGNTTLGDASTDTVTVNGYMGVGGAPASSVALWVRNSALTSATPVGIQSQPTGTSTATAGIYGYISVPATAAEVFTTNNVYGYYAFNPTKGAGSTITNLHGLYIADQTQGTNNYGITSAVSSGTNKWNIYASGTANNYFAGNVGIGTSSPGAKLQVNGSFQASSAKTVLNVISGADIPIHAAYTSADGLAPALRLGASSSGPGFWDFQPKGTNAGDLAIEKNDSEFMRITSSGYVGIGTSSPGAKLDVQDDGGGIKLNLYASIFSSNSGRYPLEIKNSTGPSALADVVFTANGRYGEFIFKSGYDGSANPVTERLRIDSSGNTIPGADNTQDFGSSTKRWNDIFVGGGVYLGGTGAANYLDDYEEGTWTPSVQGETSAGTASYAVRIGRYTKIGNQVTVWCSLIVSSATGTGNLLITGLPFTTINVASYAPLGAVLAYELPLPASTVDIIATPANNVTSVRLYCTKDDAAFERVQCDSNFNLYFTLSYLAA